MSKDTPYTYLNNILYNIKTATPMLIKFNTTKDPCDKAEALLQGGFSSILFTGLHNTGFIPDIDLSAYINLCTKTSELCFDEEDLDKCGATGELSTLKTLKNISKILEGWTEIYIRTLELQIQILEPHKERLLNLEGEKLKDYCTKLLPPFEAGYNYPELLDNFILVINTHIKKQTNIAS